MLTERMHQNRKNLQLTTSITNRNKEKDVSQLFKIMVQLLVHALTGHLHTALNGLKMQKSHFV